MNNQEKSCIVCGGFGFRSDRPYGDCCSMMCLAEKNTPRKEQERLEKLQKISPEKVKVNCLFGKYIYLTEIIS